MVINWQHKDKEFLEEDILDNYGFIEDSRGGNCNQGPFRCADVHKEKTQVDDFAFNVKLFI